MSKTRFVSKLAMGSKRPFYQLIGVVYVIAYLSLYPQYRGLIGINGLLPADQFITMRNNHFFTQNPTASVVQSFLESGNILSLSNYFGFPVDCMLELILWIGITSSIFISTGFIHPLLFFNSWIIYISLIHSSQTFLSFQWDILLCECGFLTFITTLFADESFQYPVWAFRYLAWKLMFMSGVVKLQSTCPTFRDDTSLLSQIDRDISNTYTIYQRLC